MGESRGTRREPIQRWGEHAKLNQEPYCCEATVLPTTPRCCQPSLQPHLMTFFKGFSSPVLFLWPKITNLLQRALQQQHMIDLPSIIRPLIWTRKKRGTDMQQILCTKIISKLQNGEAELGTDCKLVSRI